MDSKTKHQHCVYKKRAVGMFMDVDDLGLR